MKNLFLLVALAVFLTACSSKKGLVKRPSPAPAKHAGTPPSSPSTTPAISENVLVKRYTAPDYIDRFKTIAVAEMNKNGIPASITLAQGLLESGNGNGSLARLANNHFGIKCTTDWTGKTILQDDDQKDDCFRVYNSPEESFRDHSEFLKRKRYAFLFELDKNDYIGWANGLKTAGYATNPKYPELLISLIERYQLDQYDRRDGAQEKKLREEKVLTEIVKEIPQEQKKEAAKSPVAMKIYEVKTGDTLYAVAKRFALSVDDLKLLNNLQGTDLKAGQLLLVSK